MDTLDDIQIRYNEAQTALGILEQQLAEVRNQTFLKLPAQFGYPNVDELVVALLPLSSFGLQKALTGIPKELSIQTRPALGVGRPPRISETTKRRVLNLLRIGKLTAAQISRDTGVSVASINLMKAKAGLTASRKVA